MTQPDFEVGKAAGRLAGWRGGDGPAVVMLHGGPGLSEYMAGLVPELADSYATVRYQQRGVEPSSLSGPFSVESQLGDLLTVLDGLDIEQAVILGHSWGGHLALHLLASHPERVRAALVVDPLGAVADGGEADLGRILNERAAPVAAARAKELDDRSMRGEGTAEDALEGLALVWPGYFAHPEQAPP
ncbi:MAG: alpha/beta fold hydrolase, partial [Candidatus Dormibacteria bacterium]